MFFSKYLYINYLLLLLLLYIINKINKYINKRFAVCSIRPGPLQNIPCQLKPQSDGTVEATYVPVETGPHKVDIWLEGKPVEGKQASVPPGNARFDR